MWAWVQIDIISPGGVFWSREDAIKCCEDTLDLSWPECERLGQRIIKVTVVEGWSNPEIDFEKLARELSSCTCWPPDYTPPEDGSGPLKNGSHYANCPTENIPDIIDALRFVENAGYQRGIRRKD